MSLNFDPSLNPLPESQSYSAAHAVPAEYGKIALPDAKAPEMKGEGNSVSDGQIAKAFGLPISPGAQNVTNFFIRTVIKAL